MVDHPTATFESHIELLRGIATPVYNKFWYFACERQNIFHRRLQGDHPPWTDDPILQQYKFTNAYRASDRVSQYLIKNIIFNDNTDFNDELISDYTLLSVLLFKIFNKIETWEYLTSKICSQTTYPIDELLTEIKKVLDEYKQQGGVIYSSAYMMPSGVNTFNYQAETKHASHLLMLKDIMNHLPEMIGEYRAGDNINCFRTDFTEYLYNNLIHYEMIGPFLAYQYAVDINYIFNYGRLRKDDTENSPRLSIPYETSTFVQPGPGAISGIRKCFPMRYGSEREDQIIKTLHHYQDEEIERFGLNFNGLWGHKLELIDIQNLFCEINKYSRIAFPEIEGLDKRTKIKQTFTANNQPIDYFYPPKWGINHRIPPKYKDSKRGM